MAQATIAPAVGSTANTSSNAPQVSLRDHLNERVAPFLKKAMIASLKADPEFPLQWLGEFLINESIKYEGNPDSTNIKSHFRYQSDEPARTAPVATGDQVIPDITSNISAHGAPPTPTQVNGNSQPMQQPMSSVVAMSQDTEMQG